VRDRAEHALHSARDAASDLGDRASDAWQDTQHRVERVAHDAGQRARRAERRVEDMVQENPLAAGMVAAALGFAAGLAVPETQREHRLMGETRDRVMHRAQRGLADAQDKAREVVRETAGDTAKRAVDEVMGGGESHRRGDDMTEPRR
jgi:ElaB/YqjD/DUF883 family membrane-anchored ribosome-binding protein